MRAPRAFLSIFSPFALIFARCVRGNFFSAKPSPAQWSKKLNFQVSLESDNFLDNFGLVFCTSPTNELDPHAKYEWPLFVVPLRSLRSLRGNNRLFINDRHL